MMRISSLSLPSAMPFVGLAGLLAACQPADKVEAPTPAETVAATAPVSDGVASAPDGPLSAADLRRVCRAGLAAIHGQTVDAIEIDGLEGPVVNASWRAPVDGGRMRVQCRVDNGLIAWKPVDRPVAEQNRWMNQSGDPVIRYVLKGDVVTINQMLPDGATTTDDYAVAVQEEAR